MLCRAMPKGLIATQNSSCQRLHTAVSILSMTVPVTIIVIIVVVIIVGGLIRRIINGVAGVCGFTCGWRYNDLCIRPQGTADAIYARRKAIVTGAPCARHTCGDRHVAWEGFVIPRSRRVNTDRRAPCSTAARAANTSRTAGTPGIA